MKIYKRWWLWAIIIIIGAIICLIFQKPITCSSEYNSIDRELKYDNYCTTNHDCKTLTTGGIYVEFGCYHYINKNIDGEQLYKKMDIYWNKCSKIIDDCDKAPEAVCLNNKCIEKV